MSTKSTIKWRNQTDSAPGFHLYEDVLEALSEGEEAPIYLQLDGIDAALETQSHGASVTVTLPREMALALGLVKG